MFKWIRRIVLIIITSIGISALVILFLSKNENSNKQVTSNNQKVLSKQVTAVAQVGGYTLNSLTGFTSPFAEVQLNSVSLARKTLADGQGAFAFYAIPILPNLGELCLISQDINQLPSFPTCLAPPPSNQDIAIFDVLLSPSLSIDSSSVQTNSTVVASGMTFPNSPVEVYLYSQNETVFYYLGQWFSARQLRWPWSAAITKSATMTKLVTSCDRANNILKVVLRDLTPVKTASAFSLPKYQTKSNANGHFEFSLPNSGQSYNRFYVASALNVNKQQSTNNLSTPLRASNQQPQPTTTNKQQAINNQSDFLPKTNVAAQAGFEETVDPADLSASPKSNTLYFRSLGWLGNLINRLFAALGHFWASLGNPFGLILIEMVAVLSLLFLVIFKITSNRSL